MVIRKHPTAGCGPCGRPQRDTRTTPNPKPHPHPLPSKGRPPITLPWNRVHPIVCFHNVHSLAGAVPRAGPKTMFDRLFNHPQLGPVFVASST